MNQHLMIFELEVLGHHPGYIRHLLRYWPAVKPHLHFVVSPTFAARHAEIMQTESQVCVTWHSITSDEWQWYEASKRTMVRRMWVEWQLYCRYAKKIQADQGLIMYMDRFQAPLALRLALPCQTSGIFFRPKLHYRQFTNYQPTTAERLGTIREQWLWRRALRHPQLKTLFCLDPFAVAPLRALGGHTAVVHLPDPVEIYPQPDRGTTPLRQTLGLDPARKVLLLFGMINRRKGVYQVLEAMQQLPVAQQAQLALLLVGALAEAERTAVMAMIDHLRYNSALQLVVCDRFVRETEIQSYFDVADLVLALYQRHVGMSGILVQAAAAGKPVLAADYGLMGAVVAHHRLGLTVDSTQPNAIVAGLIAFLGTGSALGFDKPSALGFAQANAAHRFGEVIRQQVMN